MCLPHEPRKNTPRTQDDESPEGVRAWLRGGKTASGHANADLPRARKEELGTRDDPPDQQLHAMCRVRARTGTRQRPGKLA